MIFFRIYIRTASEKDEEISDGLTLIPLKLFEIMYFHRGSFTINGFTYL